MTDYTTYTGVLPANGYLFSDGTSGDVLTSPSGTYYATENGGNFWIVPGSNPTVQPCCLGYGPLAVQPDFQTDLGGYFVHMQPGGNLVAYTSATGQDQGTVVPVEASNTELGNGEQYFAYLSDDGSLQIYAGSGTEYPGSLAIPIFSSTSPFGAVSGIDLTGVTYDFNNVTFDNITNIDVAHIPLINSTNLTQQGDAQQNVTYTQSSTFSFSVADSVGETITAATKIGLPGIVQDSLSVGINNTTTITHGQSDTDSSSVTFIAGFRPEVPPMTEYMVDISGVSASYEVPYTWTGVATYANGATANVTGTGTFKGASEGDFTASVTCVIAVLPQSCGDGAAFSIPLTFTSVPEPGSVTMLFTALVAVALVKRRRLRRAA